MEFKPYGHLQSLNWPIDWRGIILSNSQFVYTWILVLKIDFDIGKKPFIFEKKKTFVDFCPWELLRSDFEASNMIAGIPGWCVGGVQGDIPWMPAPHNVCLVKALLTRTTLMSNSWFAVFFSRELNMSSSWVCVVIIMTQTISHFVVSNASWKSSVRQALSYSLDFEAAYWRFQQTRNTEVKFNFQFSVDDLDICLSKWTEFG